MHKITRNYTETKEHYTEKMELKNQSKKGPLTLKNGLTENQVTAAKDILRRVNISQCAKIAGVKITTINNVLRDASPHVDDLRKLLVQANKQIQKQQKAIKALPLNEQ